MSQVENIFKKSFIEALFASVFLVLAELAVHSFSIKSSPNLLQLGLISFAIFFLVRLIAFTLQKKLKK
jgi:hypothetical protein